MNKKLLHSCLFLILFSLSIFSINSVVSEWIYYEGKVESVSVPLPIQIKKFFYLQNDFEEEFPTTPSGNDNANAFEQIMGQITESQDTGIGNGLNNPTSDLNLKSLTAGNLPSSNFITSIDIKGAEVNNLFKKKPNSNGTETRANLEIGPEVSFLIEKDVNNSEVGGDQSWYTYTTDTPLYSNTTEIINGKEVVQVNDHINGNNLLKQNDIIKDVYRTQLVWIPDYFAATTGHYEIIKSERGYAKANYVPYNNNNNKLFIEPSTWKPGIYSGLEVVASLENSNGKYDLGATFKLNVFDNGTKTTNVIYQSSNKDIVNVDEQGNVTVTSNPLLIDYKSITVAVYDKNDYDRYGALIIKLNAQPNNNYRGIVINSDGTSDQQYALSVGNNASGYLYPSSSIDQTLKLSVNNGNKKININVNTLDQSLNILVQTIDGRVVNNVPVSKNGNTYSFTKNKYQRQDFFITFKAKSPVQYSISYK